MTNKDVIRVFGAIADLLQLQGADEFRVRSYQRAVNTIRGLSDDINRVEIESLPGIGKGLAASVRELLTTGRMALHEQLLAEVPAGLVQMLEVPELGPKTARRLYDELGIATIDAAEEAARAQRLRKLKGFGAKSEEKLLANIALWRNGRERKLAAEVQPLAELLAEAVRQVPGVERVSLAGSLRRGRDTVKDLDILAVAADSGPAIAAFCGHEIVEEVVLAGDTKATVRLAGGSLSADLRVVPRESWGAALQYFTGSQAHNIAVRARARDLGLTINEYGVKRLDDGTTVAGADEAEVYAAVGLPWITPELREDRGELAAALAGSLPALIEVGDVRGDLHNHTRWSDGLATVVEMAREARALGYAYLGICDHSQSLVVAHGLDERRVRQQWEEIARAQDEVPEVRLLRGSEVDILPDGSLDLDLGLLAELDVVVASVHVALHQPPEQMTERLLKALETGVVNVLGHPTGRLLTRREGFEFDVEAVVAACVAHNVALEVNAAPQRLDLDDVLARRAQALGARLSINTDAHATDQLHLLPWGVQQARRAWLTAADVVNTWPLDRLLTWL